MAGERIGIDASFPFTPDETKKVITWPRIFFDRRGGRAEKPCATPSAAPQ